MRYLLSLALLLALSVAAIGRTAAQEATPASGLAGLGLPELNVTVSASGYEGIPESLAAGRYLVTVTAGEDTADNGGGGVSFVQPSGMTADEFLAGLAGPGEQAGADASPEVAAASPAAGGAPPAEYYQSKFAGGTFAPSGQTAQVVLDLTPGEWIAWADDPEAAQQPVIFEVTGEMPAEMPEPPSTATLTMAEYVITVTEGALASGPQILHITNVGAQPHFIFAGKGPDDLTAEEVDAVLQGDITGTPAAVDFNPDTDFVPVFSTGTQSLGTSTWIEVNLEPGTYLLICFFPDLADGMPHAYHGMYTIVQVA